MKQVHEELRGAKIQVGELQREREELSRRLRESTLGEQLLREEMKKYKGEIEIIKNISLDLTESQH